MTPPVLLDEVLALDLLTLREHTEQAGDRFDAAEQAARLAQSLPTSTLCTVRRGGALVGYAMLSPMPDKPQSPSWFVRGFNLHPAHRSAPVLRELLTGVAAVVRRERIEDLRSHVYKTNRPSMAFHRKLGFAVMQQNDKGVEFFATVATLTMRLGRTVRSAPEPAP